MWLDLIPPQVFLPPTVLVTLLTCKSGHMVCLGLYLGGGPQSHTVHTAHSLSRQGHGLSKSVINMLTAVQL